MCEASSDAYKDSTVGKKHSATRGSHTGYTPDQRQSEDREVCHREWSY